MDSPRKPTFYLVSHFRQPESFRCTFSKNRVPQRKLQFQTYNFTGLKIVYCYTSCTGQSIVEREGLEHDERSEECSKGTSSTTCLVQRV
jgi:hypothetical protein